MPDDRRVISMKALLAIEKGSWNADDLAAALGEASSRHEAFARADLLGLADGGPVTDQDDGPEY